MQNNNDCLMPSIVHCIQLENSNVIVKTLSVTEAGERCKMAIGMNIPFSYWIENKD